MISEHEILLVEDSADDEELTLRAFEKHQIKNKVVVARDGAEALDYFRGEGIFKGRDPGILPELVLLDLKLPKVDGLEVLRQIRSNPKTALVPVVILTTSSEDIDILESYRLRANSFVRKPVDFVEFSNAIRQLGVYWLLINQRPPRDNPTGEQSTT